MEMGMGTKRIWKYMLHVNSRLCCLEEEGNTGAKVTNMEQGERRSINSKWHSFKNKGQL